MLRIHLYGKLRRLAQETDPRSESVVDVAWHGERTVEDVVRRLGLPRSELGSNLFVNGRYATLRSPIADGDRIGLFPADMSLLYRWYFAPIDGSEDRR